LPIAVLVMVMMYQTIIFGVGQQGFGYKSDRGGDLIILIDNGNINPTVVYEMELGC
jgi:hypothetical protein